MVALPGATLQLLHLVLGRLWPLGGSGGGGYAPADASAPPWDAASSTTVRAPGASCSGPRAATALAVLGLARWLPPTMQPGCLCFVALQDKEEEDVVLLTRFTNLPSFRPLAAALAHRPTLRTLCLEGLSEAADAARVWPALLCELLPSSVTHLKLEDADLDGLLVAVREGAASMLRALGDGPVDAGVGERGVSSGGSAPGEEQRGVRLHEAWSASAGVARYRSRGTLRVSVVQLWAAPEVHEVRRLVREAKEANQSLADAWRRCCAAGAGQGQVDPPPWVAVEFVSKLEAERGDDHKFNVM